MKNINDFVFIVFSHNLVTPVKLNAFKINHQNISNIFLIYLNYPNTF